MKEYSLQNCARFSNIDIASRYPSEFRQGHDRDVREKNTILYALKYIPAGSHILDLPCGTGRVAQLLIQQGYDVTAADRSHEMVMAAQKNLDPVPGKQLSTIRYSQEDLIRGTSFNDKEFDAVICHRLFHHLIDPDIRIQAIRELHRIVTGTIIFSFFNSFSLNSGFRRIKLFVRGKIPTDRIPIRKKTIITELQSEGIDIIKILPVSRGISPLCLIVAR